MPGIKHTFLISDGKEIGIGWYEAEYFGEEGDIHMYSSDVWHQDGECLPPDCCGWPDVTHWMELPELPKPKELKKLDI